MKLEERHIPYQVKSKSGKIYTKYKRILVDPEQEKLQLALRNKL